MNNTFTLLLTTVISTTSIFTTMMPAIAGWREDNQQYRQQRENSQREAESRKYNEQQREQIRQNMQPSKTTSPSNSYSTPSSSSGSSGLDGFGEIFSLFNFGPSFVSSNGVSQYGVQSKFGFENIQVRTSLNFGSGNSMNGAFTYSLSNQATIFNPFIGAGIGLKSIDKVGTIKSDEFSFYGTGGVDMQITDSISITGAVNLPTNSAYGTEFQAGINFFGSF